MTHSLEYKRRRTHRIVLLAGIFIASLTAIEILIQQLNKPVPIVNNLLVFTLLNLNIILLVVLVVVVVRNLAKLYFERKNNILGSKFQTKLIASFIILTLIPSLLLFVVASNLITQGMEGWFNEQIEHSLHESLEVAQTFYRNSIDNSLYFAEQISELNPDVPAGKFSLSLDDIVQVGQTGKRRSLQHSLNNGDLIKSIVPIQSKWEEGHVIGVLLVDYFVDGSLVAKMKNIRRAFEDYKQTKIHKNPILGNYLLTFFLITLLVFFSAIWFGMHLARGMTVPIQQLAIGTRAIAEGNLDHQVEVEANDEVGILVDSFNQMTTTLKTMTNTMAEGRHYIETILENIATGVVSINPQGRVTSFNRAASRILHVVQADVLDQHYRVFLDQPDMKQIVSVMRSMNEQGEERYEEHFQLKVDGKLLSLLVNVTTMHDEQNRYIGTLIVFDDLTQLLNAQRIAAWREVARRLAHEIKNPLTPLQLSAQRLRRQAVKKSPKYEQIFDECTQTIIDEVDGLRHLVDEFSRFARMPAVVKKPTPIHELLKNTLTSYSLYYKMIHFRARFSKEITTIQADARQLKQVFVNLLDNAIQAMEEKGEIAIQTFYDAQRRILTVKVSDTGPGIPDELRERLFIPYFSTKGSGRGLGLAIVHKIISEHGGTLKLDDNIPQGTECIIELPASQSKSNRIQPVSTPTVHTKTVSRET